MSKVTVKFGTAISVEEYNRYFEGQLLTTIEPFSRVFTIRHLRNMEKTPTGSMKPSATGGYTVLVDHTGDIFVSKCHPKLDRFCKRTGLMEAISKWLKLNVPGFWIRSMKSYSGNTICVGLEPIAFNLYDPTRQDEDGPVE